VQIDPPLKKELGRTRIDVFCANRRDPMRITMGDLSNERMSVAVGYLLPLMVKVHYVNTSQLRRHFWSVYRTLALAGWEVHISGCGAEKGKTKA
jgi:hypothetical protein